MNLDFILSTDKFLKSNLLYVNEDNQKVSPKSKDHHDKVDERKKVVGGRCLWWKVKPVWVDLLQKAFRDFSFEICQRCDVPIVEEKRELFE